LITLTESRIQEIIKNSGKTIEQVKDLVKIVTEGPVGDVIKNFGQAGADRLRSGTAQKAPSNIVQVKCPNCGGTFPANGQLPTVTCPLCGVTLQAPSQPTPQIQSPVENQPQKSQGAEPTVEQGSTSQ
jgi:ribosomal protein S27E